MYQVSLGDHSEKLRLQTQTGEGATLFAALQTAYPDAGLKLIGVTHIGATVSEHIQWNAFLSLTLALLGILVYVAFRFEMGYGAGAVIALLHDVLMSVGIFVLLGHQFSAPMVAAVLMIIGYSINDKIVVFDRIREELLLKPTMKLFDVINLAVNRTLSRTFLTSLTTFLSALALYLFGGVEIQDFALLFILGIVTGTFSSIFIASPIFYWWHKGDRRHAEERELTPKYAWDASSRDTR
ncbi:MAG: protein translocase subunit SecF [Verrucomicrobia bacterium 21-51-4]|nr:MAG: protein translocase subunit SecF [Verrucomicrobia bacterium 21-51-4]